MSVELPFATPDFDRIMRDTGVANSDAIRLIWLMLQDEINRRERFQQTSGGSGGHNLLSTTHPDTDPADPVVGDLIQALGSTPVDPGDYWIEGESELFVELNDDTGSLDYWLAGSGFLQDGFSSSSGSGTKWQRFPIGTINGYVLTVVGGQAAWAASAGGTATTFVGAVDAIFSAVSGNNNDVALGSVLTLPIDPSCCALGTVKITGLQGGTNGRVVHLVNVGASGDFQLMQEDTNSTAANRFKVSRAPMPPGAGCTLIYIGSLSRWMVV